MQISHFETHLLKIPLNKLMKTRYLTLEYSYCLLLILKTAEGVEGQGLIRSAALTDTQMVERYIHTTSGPMLLKQPTTEPETIWNTLWLAKRTHVQAGFGLYALSAIDMAIWDIFAKQQHKPLHQLLHQNPTAPAVYGNGAWLSDTYKEMATAVEWYFERGCHHFKMRIGGDDDFGRIRFLRQTFGDTLILSADANQYYDFATACEVSKMLADFNIAWFEEPLFSSSLTELAQLAKLSPVPIATGENMNSHWQIQDACALGVATIFQPDVIFQGGITEFKRSATCIQAHECAMGTHLFHELSVSLAGLCDQSYVEHLDFFPSDLFEHPFEIKTGKIALVDAPGHGATVTKMAIQKYYIPR